ncbi:MAG: M16 family metallopeptidase [Gammaproteobacteria bacterium]
MRIALASVLIALSVAAEAATTATEFALGNGLRVIVQEDHRAPVAVVQIWYRVGGSDETDGTTGLSHALEHMMFKRTTHLATGEFSRRVAARGGRENAFTTADYTTYFQQWSADEVAQSFALEAERMQYLELDPEEFANEMKVIREERRLRTDDDAQARAMEAVLAHTWQTSPYRQPVIGWAADIEQLTLEDLRKWYARYYTPDNALVVVVGDVQPEEIRSLAERHFGGIPRRAPPARKSRPEVAQRGPKRLTIADPELRLPRVTLHYKVPGLTGIGTGEPAIEPWEIYALEVLASTFDGGASARFPRELVRGREIALAAGTSYSSTSRLPDLFTFDAVPREGVELPALEAALRAQIAAIQAEPPAADELARIKRAVVADNVFQQDSMFSQAMIIGALAINGIDWRLKDRYVENIEAVTPAQVQQVARKYLRDEVLTVAHLVPENPRD